LKGKDFAVQRPGAEASRTAGQVTADERQSFLRYAGTEKSRRISREHRRRAGRDFRRADGSRGKRPARGEVGSVGGNSHVPRGETKKAESAARMVVTREFWTPLLWIVAAIFVMEALLAHRISHARPRMSAALPMLAVLSDVGHRQWNLSYEGIFARLGIPPLSSCWPRARSRTYLETRRRRHALAAAWTRGAAVVGVCRARWFAGQAVC